MNTARIFIADDHDVVRQGVSSVIQAETDWKVCGECGDGRETVAQVLELKPDIVILDVALPRLGTIESMRQIRRELPDTQFLIFTGRECEDLAAQLLAAGARAFVLKSEAAETLIPAIRALLAGKPFFGGFSSSMAIHLAMQATAKLGTRPPDELSPREREIVQLLAEGSSNKDVANLLGISVKTAETHRAAIIKKMGFNTFAELVRYAVRNHLVSE
ncbi:MAG TPA: response regulator transcription factor [Chthoniobacter sp.]|jgi:DNA-binding NarL/FixJ family response regulator